MLVYFLLIVSKVHSELTEVLNTELLFDCWSSLCSSLSIGNSECNSLCMSPMCNYDSSDTTSETWQRRFDSSDCFSECLASGCDTTNLGNGSCEETCNSTVCGYDLGDCSYCDINCSLEDLKNDTKDDSCNSPQCRFDNNMFGWCAEGCFRDDLDADFCPAACNDSMCTSLTCTHCSENCSLQSLGNGTCEEDCFNESCNYDSGDCECSPGCPSYFDKAQNTWISSSGCSPECMNPSCLYNYPFACTDEAYIEIHLMHQIKQNNLYAVFDESACDDTGCSGDNRRDVINDRSCTYSDCNNTQCADCLGYTNSDCEEYCSSCSASSSTCYRCQYAMQDFTCLETEKCPGRYKLFNFDSGLKICIPKVDLSTLESPYYIYVQESSNESSNQQDGSQENPYTHLEEAFAEVWAGYTVIKLLSGDHYFSVLEVINNTDIIDTYSPLYRNQDTGIKQITLEGEDNSRILFYGNQTMVINARAEKLTIKNIIFSAEYFLDGECKSETCRYCPYNEEVNGILYDDRQNAIDYEFPKHCDEFKNYNLIIVENGCNLEIHDSIFQHFRYQGRSLINSYNEVYLNNVTFYKIQSSEAVIVLSTGASLTFEGGSVEYLNDGYEVSASTDLKGFVSSSEFNSAHFFDVEFKKILILDTTNADNVGLFWFYLPKGTVTFEQCTFDSIYVRNLFNVDFRLLIYNEEDILNGAYSQIHFSLTNNQFSNIYNEAVMIYVRTYYETVRNSFRNNTFHNILSMYPVIVLTNFGEVKEMDINGEDVLVETENETNTVSNPPRTVEISDTKFSNVFFFYFLLVVESFPVLNIHNMNFSDSGDGYMSSINEEILSRFIKDEDSYITLERELESSEMIRCSEMVRVDGIHNFDIDQIEITRITCNQQNSVVGFKFLNIAAGTSNAIRNFEVRDITSTSTRSHVIFIEDSSEITFSDTTFSNITGEKIYTIFAENCEGLALERTTMENIYSDKNGAINLDKVLHVRVSNSSFNNVSTSNGNGGTINYKMPFLDTIHPSLTVESTYFYLCSSVNNKGGAIYLTSEAVNILLDLSITNTEFIWTIGREGSAVYIGQEISINTGLVSNCTFSLNYSYLGGVIHDMHFSGEMVYRGLNFYQNTGYVCGLYGFYIASSSKPAIIENSKFENNTCSVGTMNFILFKVTEMITVKSCNFTSNQGTSVMGQFGSIEIEDCKFNNEVVGILAKHDNSVYAKRLEMTNGYFGILCEDNSFTACDDCKFINNSYSNIIVRIGSYVNISNSLFEENSGVDYTSILINSSTLTTTITNSKFLKNFSTHLGPVLVVNAPIEITDCVFEENYNSGGFQALYTGLSDVIIRNSQFKNQYSNGGIYIEITHGSAIFENCYFYNITNEESSAITGRASEITITDCTFEELFLTGDGCIEVVPNQQLNIRNTSFFHSVTHNVIHVNSGEAILDSVNITNCYGTAIQGITAKSVIIENSRFENLNTANGSVRMSQVGIVDIRNSHFSTIHSLNVGACLNLNVLANYDDIQNYNIDSCSFANCYSNRGGAVYSNDAKLSITNSSFTHNNATIEGGAIYSSCPKNTGCSLSISNSSFIGNKADFAGGAVRWLDKAPLLMNNTYEGNSATYGDDIASYATTISSSSRILTDATKLTGIAPGQPTEQPIIVTLRDQYGNIVVTDSSSTATLVAYDTEVQLSGTIKVTAVNGTYIFDDYIIGFTPNSEIVIGVVSDGISHDLYENSGDTSDYISEIEIEIELRDCVMGEENTGNACYPCEEHKYSLDPSQLCEACPSEAVCPGLWEMYPKKEYWRTDMYTDKFYKCPNPEACLGGEETSSYTGTCEDGYKGNMCQSCAKGYSRSSANTCIKCPGIAISVVYLFFVLLGVIGFSIFLVRSTFQSAYTSEALHSIYLKIMTNYIQLVFLTTQFNLSWPDYVLEMFSIQESTATISEQIFSIDCYIEDLYEDSEFEKTYYSRLIFLSVTPFFLILISFAIWFIIGKRRRDLSVLHKEMIATIVVLFFFLHPTITKVFFSVFSCREIEGYDLWLVDNLNIKCWDEEHSKYAFGVALPSLLLWSILTPILTLMIMYKKRNELYLIKNRIRFGFLFNGFRDKRYYWEFVILYRKIMIIALSVFLSNISIPVQALTVLLLLFGSLYLHSRYRPFGIDHLNDMENIGILVATVTIYCGLYFLTEDLDENSKLLFFFMMVAFNIYFLVYWVSYMFNHIIGLVFMKIPFLRKSHLKKDGFSEDPLKKIQVKQFSFFNREHKFYSLFKQVKTEDFIQDEPESRKLKSGINLYMKNIRLNYLAYENRENAFNSFSFVEESY